MSLFLQFYFIFDFYDFFSSDNQPPSCTLFLPLAITKRLRHVTVHPPLRQVSEWKSPGLPDRGLWLLQSETRVRNESAWMYLYLSHVSHLIDFLMFILMTAITEKKTVHYALCRLISCSKHYQLFKDRLTPCWSLTVRPTIWPTVSSTRLSCSFSAI